MPRHCQAEGDARSGPAFDENREAGNHVVGWNPRPPLAPSRGVMGADNGQAPGPDWVSAARVTFRTEPGPG